MASRLLSQHAMPRQPRFFRPNTMYEIVTRTVAGRLLLRPDPELTERLLGAIGHAQSRFPIPLHAFNYLSNHGHTALTSDGTDSIPSFLQLLHRNIAEAVRSVRKWRGPVLMRYCAIPILDDAAVVRRIRYILANGVKEGLVAHPLEWPGVSSASAMLSEEPIATTWTRVMPRGGAPMTEHNPIRLTVPGCWAELPHEKRRARLRQLMDDIAAEARVARRGAPPLGVAGLLAMNPMTPTPIEHSVPPLAHFTDAAAYADYLRDWEAFLDAHRASTEAQRRTGAAVDFPPHGFPTAPPFRVP